MKFIKPRDMLPAVVETMELAVVPAEEVVYAKLIAVIPPKVSRRDERRRVEPEDLGNNVDVFA
jgi:hypothetical protein